MEKQIHKNPEHWGNDFKLFLNKIVAYYQGEIKLVDFSDLIFGFCISEDRASQWFREIIRRGFPIGGFFSSKHIDEKILEYAKESTVIFSDEQRKKLKFSISANRVLKIASDISANYEKVRYSKKTDESKKEPILITTNFLMAALIFGDHGHDKQFDSWGFNRKKWANSFIWFLRVYDVENISIESSAKAQTERRKRNQRVREFWLNLYTEKFGAYVSHEQEEESNEDTAISALEEFNQIRREKGVGPIILFLEKYQRSLVGSERSAFKRRMERRKRKKHYPKPEVKPVPKAEAPKPEVKLKKASPYKGVLPKTSTKEKITNEVSILSDKYTTEDKLQYWPYVHSLYKFIMGSSRKSPVTISIQAPWGGGKTSFMRMLQKLLDPDYTESQEEATPEQFARLEELEKQIEELKPQSNQVTETKEDSPYTKFVKDYDLIQKESFDSEKAFQISENNNDKDGHRLTVWFNAWKYEESDQVWAGFAHHLIEEITKRLEPEDQRKFWINYRKEKINKQEIQNKIDEMLNEVVETRLAVELPKKILKWVLPLIGGFIVSGLTMILSPIADNGVSLGQGVGGLGAIGSIGISMFARSWQKNELSEKLSEELRGVIESKVYNETVKPVISIPDYSKKLGFAFSVEEDIKFIIESVPEKYRPITIFIDDLDRCPPDKVAKIMEALNRMVASDIPHCNFVLGVDAQLVAAALENAYDPIITKMPRYAKKVPIGIKFMDKFVQLPILVPQPDSEILLKFFRSNWNTSNNENETIQDKQRSIAEVIDGVIEKFGKDQGTIEDLAFPNESVSGAINAKISPRLSNPRSIKLYLNMIKFQFFMALTREALTLTPPSPEQLDMWVMIQIKWPDIARWIIHSMDIDESYEKFDFLQNEVPICTKISELKEKMETRFHIETEKMPTLNDESFLRFYKNHLNVDITDYAKIGLY